MFITAAYRRSNSLGNHRKDVYIYGNETNISLGKEKKN